ncbi:hypothetical protein HYX16_01465 [Candidatus Woesearchaeota archaeon]|nr:hypothetical protein [Candidatus Woesearchaeota archaeon]
MSFTLDIVGGSPKPSWIKISYSGVYDLHKVYRDIVEWFKSYHYFFNEKTHVEMIRPDGKSHKIDFKSDRKIDEYAKFIIEVEIWTLRTKEVNIKENGKDVKMNSGDIQIRVKGSMELDYLNTFDRYGKMGKVMRNYYHNYIIKNKIWTRYAPSIYSETNNLISSIKKDLGQVTA